MVNPKIRRMMIVTLSILFMATVFRCQVYESTWSKAQNQIYYKKQIQTEQIKEAELDKFIQDMEKWKVSGLFEEKVTSFDVSNTSETIDWRAKVWFVYHQWEADRFFYVQSRAAMLLKSLKDKSVDEARVIIDNYLAMLHGESYNEDLLEEANAFVNTSKQANRIKCATLSWNGLKDIIDGK